MKRMLVSVFMFAAVAAVCAWEACYLNSLSSEMNLKLAEVKKQYAAQEYAEAQKTAKDIELSWEKAENILCHFVSVDGLYEVGTAVSALPYLAADENDDFAIEYRKLQVLFEHMLNGERVTVY